MKDNCEAPFYSEPFPTEKTPYAPAHYGPSQPMKPKSHMNKWASRDAVMGAVNGKKST